MLSWAWYFTSFSHQMIPSFFLLLLLLLFSPPTLSSMKMGEGSSALKSSALLYTILCSISGCGVREASCYNWKQDLSPFPKIETSMEMNVPLCEYQDDGWDDGSKQPCHTPLLQENSFPQGGRFWAHQMKGIEDMTIDTLIQTLPTQ